VLRNLDALIQDKPHAIVVIVLTTAIGTAVLYTLECELYKHVAGTPLDERHATTAYTSSLVSLALFLLDCASNVLVQLTSSLAATMAISVFSSARSLLWGFAGAFGSLTLLWMLKRVLTARVQATPADAGRKGV